MKTTKSRRTNASSPTKAQSAMRSVGKNEPKSPRKTTKQEKKKKKQKKGRLILSDVVKANGSDSGP